MKLDPCHYWGLKGRLTISVILGEKIEKERFTDIPITKASSLKFFFDFLQIMYYLVIEKTRIITTKNCLIFSWYWPSYSVTYHVSPTWFKTVGRQFVTRSWRPRKHFFMLTPISIPWFQRDVDCRESGSSVFRLVRSFTREVRRLQHGGKYLAANGTSSDALYLTDKVKARLNRFKLMCI